MFDASATRSKHRTVILIVIVHARMPWNKPVAALLDEADDILSDASNPAVTIAAIIAAGQRLEHFRQSFADKDVPPHRVCYSLVK